MPQVQVIATATGYDNVSVREAGDLFTVDEALLNTNPKPTWFKRAVKRAAPQEVIVAEDEVPGEQGEQGDLKDPKVGPDLESELV